MKKMLDGYLSMIVICPVCKEKRRMGEMMCGTKKEICKYCYEKENGMKAINDIAAMLNGRKYGYELTDTEEQEIADLGYVVVFGYSDDNAEFRGAIDDEIGCFNGGKVYENNGYYINALWCKNEFTWSYDTNIPHATFCIYDEDEKYCKGIVFDLNVVKENSDD